MERQYRYRPRRVLELGDRIRRLAVLAAALALAVTVAPAALAQSDRTGKDVAENGAPLAGAAQAPPGQDNPEYQQTTPTTTTPSTTAPTEEGTGDEVPDDESGTQDDTSEQAPDEAQSAPRASGRLGRTLPMTGLPAGLVAGLGIALLSLGALLRRRTSD